MKISSTILVHLTEWYRNQCDGDWEHSYGVKIETIDNPGWLVAIDLKDTEWEHIVASRIIVQRSETDWIQSEITDTVFIGSGGIGNLEEVLELFLKVVR
jgi:hypothetical protein